MLYRRWAYTLIVISFLGMAGVKLASSGYLFATTESEAQIEQRADEWAGMLLPEASKPLVGLAKNLVAGGQLRARQERLARATDSLQAGLIILTLVLVLHGERRAQLDRNEAVKPSG